jgi:hypothetical protein
MAGDYSTDVAAIVAEEDGSETLSGWVWNARTTGQKLAQVNTSIEALKRKIAASTWPRQNPAGLAGFTKFWSDWRAFVAENGGLLARVFSNAAEKGLHEFAYKLDEWRKQFESETGTRAAATPPATPAPKMPAARPKPPFTEAPLFKAGVLLLSVGGAAFAISKIIGGKK